MNRRTAKDRPASLGKSTSWKEATAKNSACDYFPEWFNQCQAMQHETDADMENTTIRFQCDTCNRFEEFEIE